MLKKLIVILAFAFLYLHFYPNKNIDDFLADNKSQLIEGLNEATDTKVRLKADKIYYDLKPQFKSFTDDEIEYLKKLTKDHDATIEFYHTYCKSNNYNENFHATNLAKICKAMNKYNYLM